MRTCPTTKEGKDCTEIVYKTGGQKFFNEKYAKEYRRKMKISGGITKEKTTVKNGNALCIYYTSTGGSCYDPTTKQGDITHF